MRLERLLSIPAILVGSGLIYVGYFEFDYIYLFFYFLLGSSLTLFGIILLLGYGMGRAPKKKKSEARSEEIGESEQPEVRAPEYCPSCGAPVLSAGKFCGSCGRSIPVSSSTKEA